MRNLLLLGGDSAQKVPCQTCSFNLQGPAQWPRIVSASSMDGLDRSRRRPGALKVKYLPVEGGKSEIAFQSVAARSVVGVLDELPYVSENVLVPAIQCPNTIDRGSSGRSQLFWGCCQLGLARCACNPLSQGGYQMLSSGRYETRGKLFAEPQLLQVL